MNDTNYEEFDDSDEEQYMPSFTIRKVKHVLSSAIKDYNKYKMDRILDEAEWRPATSDSPSDFLDRIAVNYIRHVLVETDDEIINEEGLPSTDKKEYRDLFERIYDAIAETYPQYAAECNRQFNQKFGPEAMWAYRHREKHNASVDKRLRGPAVFPEEKLTRPDEESRYYTKCSSPKIRREFGKRNKLGGKPDWIQGDQTPFCPKCGSRMSFHAQLDSIDAEHGIGDMGLIYVFICYRCLKTETIIQCY